MSERRALILRTCNPDMTSFGGFVWPRSGHVAAPDWDPAVRCGNGFHGLLWGEGDCSLVSWAKDAVWLVAAVDPSEVVDLGGKVKFPKAEVLFAGTRAVATRYLFDNGGAGRAITGLVASADCHAVLRGGSMAMLVAGNHSTVTGDAYSTVTGGDGSTVTGGAYSTVTGGDGSTVTGGAYSTVTGGAYSIVVGGMGATVKGRAGAVLVLREGGKGVVSGLVDGIRLLPSVFYRYREGVLVPVAEDAG